MALCLRAIAGNKTNLLLSENNIIIKYNIIFKTLSKDITEKNKNH